MYSLMFPEEEKKWNIFPCKSNYLKILSNKKFRRGCVPFFFSLKSLQKLKLPHSPASALWSHLFIIYLLFLCSCLFSSCHLSEHPEKAGRETAFPWDYKEQARPLQNVCSGQGLSPCAPVSGRVSLALPLVKRIQIRMSINVQFKRLKTHWTQTYTNNYPFGGKYSVTVSY